MGNYELLKAAINQVIKANGRQEITGEVLNQVLLSMVNSLGAGYQCMGVATPSTNPGTPDQNVFYFATQAGTYTNFDAIVLQAGISVLIWDGDWASQTWFTIDSTPTNNSQNLIASGGVFDFSSSVVPKLKYNKTDVSGWTTYGYFKALEGYTYTFKAKLSELANADKYFLLTESPTSESGITGFNFTIAEGETEGFKTFTNDTERTIYVRSYGTLSGVEITIENNTIIDIGKNINELKQDQQTIDILKLSYVQGSLYQNNLENNSKCIACLDYIGIEDLNNTLVVVNQKQQDGKYWKVRVTFCDASKTYIRQDGYTFIDGSWNITIPQNAKFARFSISLIDSDGTDISCTPADIPTDGTRILLNKSSVAFLLKDVTELHQNVTELQQDVSELKSFYEPIPLNRLLGYSFTLLFNVTSGYGDAACYNGLIFQFVNGNEYVYVHDAADGTLVQTITMPNPNSAYHNNSVSFGSEKYDEADTYPLLYASQENSAQNKCIVYRVTGTIGNLTLEVVQTITYPANYVTQLYYHNCYIDTKNNYLILGGLVNSSWSATDGNTLQYMAFALPALASGNVTLDMANVLFKSPRFANMPTTQGGFCKNGYLYQVFGVSAPQLFMVFDIKHCKFCYVFNFTEELMNAEPEGAFEYDNKVCVVFNGGTVYKLNP